MWTQTRLLMINRVALCLIHVLTNMLILTSDFSDNVPMTLQLDVQNFSSYPQLKMKQPHVGDLGLINPDTEHQKTAFKSEGTVKPERGTGTIRTK